MSIVENPDSTNPLVKAYGGGSESFDDIGKDNAQELPQKAEWLKKKMAESIDYVGKNRSGNRRKATYIKVIVIAFSGAATILLGLQVTGFEPLFKDIAFVLIALISLFAAVEPFFNYRALWVEHERAEYKFHRLLDEFEFYLVGVKPENLSAKKLNEFNQRYQEIWVNLSETWLDQRQSNRYNV